MSRRRGTDSAEPLAGLQAVSLDAQAISLLAEADHHPRKREPLALLQAYDRADTQCGVTATRPCNCWWRREWPPNDGFLTTPRPPTRVSPHASIY